MSTRDSAIDLAVGGQQMAATVVAPDTMVPGVLLIHGWQGSQAQYLARARAIAALGCICLTFDMRGHARSDGRKETVTREDNLNDVVAAYDRLRAYPGVDKDAIAVIGSSYGGYLATILGSLRPVTWLGLRAPALYKDDDWHLPKAQLDRHQLKIYRQTTLSAEENRALRACAEFEGDVLIVESEHDDIVPHPVIANYMAAFEKAHSLTYRVIAGADHGLTTDDSQAAYTELLVAWATEMVIGGRAGPEGAGAQKRARASGRERWRAV